MSGTVDEHTLIWGEGLGDFIPIRNVTTLVAQIRTPEVRFATWLTKKLVLGPKLSSARKQRVDQRPSLNSQVDRMF